MSRYREDKNSSLLTGGSIFRDRGKGPYSVFHQTGIKSEYKSSWDTVHSPPYVAESGLDLIRNKVGTRPSITVFDSKRGSRRTTNYDFSGGTASSIDLGPVGVQAYVNQALVALNPNKPIVDVPLFLFELREYPRMLRDLGNLLRRKPGSTNPGSIYLSHKFGWAPLFGDLVTLANLVNEVSRATEHLDKNIARRSASGRLDSYSTNWKGRTKLFRINSREDFRWRWAYRGSREVWYSTRLEPDFTAPLFDESQMQKLNRVIGLNESASTLWNMVPWSWLIDYFTSIGSYLEATRGVLPYAIRDMNIMCHDRAYRTSLRVSSNYSTYQYKPGGGSSERKRRWVYPVPKARIVFKPNPLQDKAGIITSLFVARFRGRI